MKPQLAKDKNPVSIFIAQQAWIDSIEKILEYMVSPICINSKSETEVQTERLKVILAQAYSETQKFLLVNNTSGGGLFVSDPVGWTTATTAFGSEANVKKCPPAALVNKILKEFIEADNKEAVDSKLPTSAANILAAQLDAIDPLKSEIKLNSTVQPNGEKTDLAINKQTGDTEVTQTDSEGKVSKFTIKGFWKNVKDFCVNIWGWICKQCSGAYNWIKSFFTVPEDKDVILATIE